MTSSERRRVRFLFLLLAGVPVFLAGWLGWLQVLQAGSLRRPGAEAVRLSARAADVQRDRGERRPGPRGTIVDRHGAALATDCDAFEVRAEVRPPRSARADGAALRAFCHDLARRLADALCRDPGLADRAAARKEHEARLRRRLEAAFAQGRRAVSPSHAEILVASGVAVLPVLEALDELDASSSSVLLHLQHDHVRVYPERELTWGLVGYLEDVPIHDERGALCAFEPFAPVGLEAMAALLPGAPGSRAFRVDSQHRRFFAGAGDPAAPARKPRRARSNGRRWPRGRTAARGRTGVPWYSSKSTAATCWPRRRGIATCARPAAPRSRPTSSSTSPGRS
jgi:cell division protein FtsI/penicillin-binding protein 2